MKFRRRYLTGIVTILVLCLVITIGVKSQDAESIYEVRNANGNIALIISMKDGEISIQSRSKAAGSNVSIRWHTIGLSITREPIRSETSTKGYTGPGPVNDAASSGVAQIYFEQAAKKTSYQQGEEIFSTITFSEDQIKNALKDDFSNLKKGTKIYLHGIFRSFDYENKNGNEIKTTRKGDIRNWKDIMEAEFWSKGTLEGFSKFFNMEIMFMPSPEDNSIYYVTQDGTFIAPKANLKSKLIDDKVSWSNEPATINYYDSDYKIIGYYVTQKLDQTKKWVDEGFLSKGKNINQIRSGSTRVYLGGMEVFLVYQKQINDEPDLPDPIDPGIEPQKESYKLNLEPPRLSGLIQADPKNSEYFDVNQSIPTTESLYTNVDASSYLLGYHFEKKTGSQTYPVKVKKEYILSWTGETDSGEVPLTQKQVIERVVNVNRSYGYWEIENFDLYEVDTASISNYSLPGGSSNIQGNTDKTKTPKVTINHSSLRNDHIIVPSEIKNGITLKTQTIYGDKTKPSIPQEDFTMLANERTPSLKVKNDSLTIDGVVILDDSIAKTEGPQINKEYLNKIREKGNLLSHELSLLEEDLPIDKTKENGLYHSSGIAKYKRLASMQSKFNNFIEYNIPNVNSVVIHTPVVCNILYSSDNEKYVQLDQTSPSLNLVIDNDKDPNNFSLAISNYGFHSNKKGYKERDYRYSLKSKDTNNAGLSKKDSSYLAMKNGKLRNEVKFPFDIYIHNKKGEKTLVEKNTWTILGEESHEFSLPLWVSEGSYTSMCRSIAANADMSKLDQTSQAYANTNISNYIATNTFDIEVSGRIYGLTIYDVTDYPIWQDVFRIDNSLELKRNKADIYMDGTQGLDYYKNYRYDYTVGTRDQYGKETGRLGKYTFPLIDGSHPIYSNMGTLKPGYGVRFKLTTTGNMYSEGSSIIIRPSFYHVDKNGKNRREVELYYEEMVGGQNHQFVKVTSSLDQINIKFQEVASPYLGIPKVELENTAKILKKDYADLLERREGLFNFGHMQISSLFRTFPIPDSKFIQNWYGYYYLPSIINIAPKGYDVYEQARKYGLTFHEDFWLEDGYIIVNFEIMTFDNDGNHRLNYYSPDKSNPETPNLENNKGMWLVEGFNSKKKSSTGTKFEFKEGDFLVYDISSSIHDDYNLAGGY